MNTKKRDVKANDKRQAKFNKPGPNKFSKDSDKPKTFNKTKAKPDGKNGKKDGKGAPILNRRQKQKVSDLVKQLRVRDFTN